MSLEQAYGAISMEGIAEYGPSFQVINSLHLSVADNTYLGRLEYDNDAWSRQGGCLGVQLIDGLFQMALLLPCKDPETVYYAGGFQVCEQAKLAITGLLWPPPL